jgi:type I restriction enzyme R subunit
MTGSSSDPQPMQPHIRNKAARKAIGERLKDPDDHLRLVIVRDMWLTGFDAPRLHTLYVDKPMQGHNLMQAIARVNRVYKDKPGGLVVDYIGIASDLKRALATYSDFARQGIRPGGSGRGGHGHQGRAGLLPGGESQTGQI